MNISMIISWLYVICFTWN